MSFETDIAHLQLQLASLHSAALSAPSSDVVILTARYVLPITSSPIVNGAIAIEKDRIVAIGTRTEIQSRYPHAVVRDFGEAVLLPGLVNVHTHLELTALRGRLENLPFQKWIGNLVRYKREQMTEGDLLTSARVGCLEAVQSGITTIADTSESHVTLQALIESGLRGVIYQECFGPQPEQVADSLSDLKRKLAVHHEKLAATDAATQSRIRLGISPHAPYSVSAQLYASVAEYSMREKYDLALHTAESADEASLLRDGTGKFADFLRSRGIAVSAPRCSTIQYLEKLGVLKTAPLLIHCVTVDDEDIALMAANKVRIAHCPKSNAKLGHGLAPLLKFNRAGITTGLGTDSVGSNNTCDLMEEARFAVLMQQAAHQDCSLLPADEILRMMTIEGARALHLESEIGSLETGKQADVIAINLSGAHLTPHDNIEAALLFSSSARDVKMTMIAGRLLDSRSK
jgi:5-methylthioadenosine/S-adenosylhomocysteine deaminase